jgi:hypothetical protein
VNLSSLIPHALLAAARTPLQVAALAYVGAAGLAGTAVVTGVLLTPARDAVQQAMAPAAELVQSIVPGALALPPAFEVRPVPPVASRQPLLTEPPTIDLPAGESIEATLEPQVIDEASSTPQTRPNGVGIARQPGASPTATAPPEPPLILPADPPLSMRGAFQPVPTEAPAPPRRVPRLSPASTDQQADSRPLQTSTTMRVPTAFSQPAHFAPTDTASPEPTQAAVEAETLAPTPVPTVEPTLAAVIAPSSAPSEASPKASPPLKPEKTDKPVKADEPPKADKPARADKPAKTDQQPPPPAKHEQAPATAKAEQAPAAQAQKAAQPHPTAPPAPPRAPTSEPSKPSPHPDKDSTPGRG